MKRIRATKRFTISGVDGAMIVERGAVLDVEPNALADLLCAPMCPECGMASMRQETAYPGIPGSYPIEVAADKPGGRCPYCIHVCETAEEVGVLVPGLAETWKPCTLSCWCHNGERGGPVRTCRECGCMGRGP